MLSSVGTDKFAWLLLLSLLSSSPAVVAAQSFSLSLSLPCRVTSIHALLSIRTIERPPAIRVSILPKARPDSKEKKMSSLHGHNGDKKREREEP